MFKCPEEMSGYSETEYISDDSGISQMTNSTQQSNIDLDRNPNKSSITTDKKLTRVTCKCGANNCRKFLY